MMFCECPKCGYDFNAGDISEESLDKGLYGGRTCETCGKPKHFSHLIGIYDQDRDRTGAWMCPACGFRWVRGTDPRKKLSRGA